MKSKQSIQLQKMEQSDLQNEISSYNIAAVSTNLKKGEYRELFPDLSLNKEEAICRSRKFRILLRTQVKPRSIIKSFTNKIDVWNSVKTIISTDYGMDSCIYFKLSRWLGFHVAWVFLACLLFLIIPMIAIYYQDQTNVFLDTDVYSTILNPNENWLINSPMFFGFYTQRQGFNTTYVYSISRAYFWVNGLTRLIYVLVLVRKFIFSISTVYTERYSSSVLESTMGVGYILGMWDFRSLTKRSTVYSTVNIRDFIKKAYSNKKLSKKVTMSLNIVINIICLGIIVIICERISWLIYEDEVYFQKSQSGLNSTSEYLRSPIVVSVLIICATWIFDLLKCIEDYTKEYLEILTSAGRIVILNLGISITLIYQWSALISCTQTEMISPNITTCSLLRGSISISSHSLLRTCWETWLGQRVLIYLLVNIVLSFGFYFLIDSIKMILKYSQISFIKPEFFYTALIGNMCYMDFLFWFGYYYSPFLPLIWLLSVLLLFFYNINIISVTCFPRCFSSGIVSLKKSIFILMLLISSFTGIGGLIYHSALFRPSRHCGPFTNLKYNYESEKFPFSNYDNNNKFLAEVISIGDQLLLSDGLWYSIMIIFLSLAFKYTYRVNALQKIYILAVADKKMIENENRLAAEDCLGYVEKLKEKTSNFMPTRNVSEDDKLDKEFRNFVI